MFQEHGEEAYLKQFGRSLPKAQLEMLKDVRRSKFKATTLQMRRQVRAAAYLIL
jgi:hypothetical protein